MLFLGSDDQPVGIQIPPYPSQRPIAKADRRQMMFVVPGAGINTRYISPMGTDDPGIEIPPYPSEIPIGPPNLHQLKFDIPGAGLESRYIGPKPIAKGPSTKIQTREELNSPSMKAAFLETTREKVGPIYDALSKIKDGKERAEAIELAFGMFRPGSSARIEKNTIYLISTGMPASSAFKEALARELAATVLSKPIAVEQLIGAQGLGGPLDFIRKVGRGIKNVAKATVAVVGSVVGSVGDVACAVANNRTLKKIPVAGGASDGVCGVAKDVNEALCDVAKTNCPPKKKPKPTPTPTPKYKLFSSVLPPKRRPRPASVRAQVPDIKINIPPSRELPPPPPPPSNLPMILAVGGVGVALLLVVMQGRRA